MWRPDSEKLSRLLQNCGPRARNKGCFPSLPLHETPTRKCLRYKRANMGCSSLFLDLWEAGSPLGQIA